MWKQMEWIVKWFLTEYFKNRLQGKLVYSSHHSLCSLHLCSKCHRNQPHDGKLQLVLAVCNILAVNWHWTKKVLFCFFCFFKTKRKFLLIYFFNNLFYFFHHAINFKSNFTFFDSYSLIFYFDRRGVIVSNCFFLFE